MGSKAVLVAYVATPHAGYLKLFRAYEGGVLYILGDEFIQEFSSLVRHLPGVKPVEVQKMILALGIFSDVRILTKNDLYVVEQSNLVVMPDEDVAHVMAEKYLSGVSVMFDNSWFLRWDWGATQAKRRPEGEQVISIDEYDRSLMRLASSIAERSPDWWRQIGALLVRRKQILIFSFNQHMPHEQSVYCYGDPRSNCEPGHHIDVSGALHAEAKIVATAAQRGISMKGCDLYVTTFPCPPCAYLCASSGIRRLFYMEGYSLIAGAEALQSKGVEIIRVEM